MRINIWFLFYKESYFRYNRFDCVFFALLLLQTVEMFELIYKYLE